VTPEGKPGNVGTGVATPAVPVAGAQQWMCAAVTALGEPLAVVLTKPLKLTLTVMMFPSTVTVAKPVPGEFAGFGLSFAPESVAVKTSGSAFATPANAAKAATKTRRATILFITHLFL
jgi:hypothetical protein